MPSWTLCTRSAPLHDDIPVSSTNGFNDLSQLQKVVLMESIVVRFNGALNFNFSVYPSRPSQKFRINAAWIRMAHNIGPTRMTREEMLKAGTTDLRSQVRYPDKISGGFAVSLETAHRMHCLASRTTFTVRSWFTLM
ncbi:hypothetical protein BDR03DRAFT_955683 [Suillus americanus]|nr:hypothetical protein BDR03DRAFT_955683 [Suillus americanus]